MKLRIADERDILSMVELGRLAHSESRYAHMAYAPAKLQKNLEGLLKLQHQGTHCVLLAEQAGQIMGGLVGALEEPFFTEAKSASTILIWVNPAHRGGRAALKLIHAFKNWAVRAQATEICVVVASGVRIGKTDRFLTRLGFRQTGGNYAMGLG